MKAELLTFRALIDGVHYDPKKGTVKIQLVATSHVSMDKLTTLAPQDESIQITLESLQTKIADVGDSTTLGEKGAKWLDEAARKLAEDEEDEGELNPEEDPNIPATDKTEDPVDRLPYDGEIDEPDDPLTTPYTGGDDDDEEDEGEDKEG